jgi:SAM-dependent methyltransferase
LLYTMYGSEHTDLLVKYYDLAFGISGEAETGWYLSKAQAFGGPVLDLACGTGRLAIMLSQHDFEITAIDSSEGMLNLFRDKLRAQPPEVGRRIRILNQRMSDFDLGTRFNTILCCDAFFHNLTIEEQIRCLRRVASHLTADGRFVFNLPNPTWDFILKSEQSAGREFEERGRYRLERGQGALLVEQAHGVNTLEQTITTTFRFTRFDAKGNEVESGQSHWSSRYLFYYEAVLLLERCGFEIEALVGDYHNGPITEQGQLIFQVRFGEQVGSG